MIFSIIAVFVFLNIFDGLRRNKPPQADINTTPNAITASPSASGLDAIDLLIIGCMVIAAFVLYSVLQGIRKRGQDEIIADIRKIANRETASLPVIVPDEAVKKAEAELFSKISAKDSSPKIYKKKRDKVLTKFETKMYNRLTEAFPDYLIQYQVGLSQLVDVSEDVKFWDRRGQFSRIARLIIDFVIVDKQHNVVACIELDDWTHTRPDRVDADKRKNEALESAGYKLLRYTHVPTIEELKKHVLQV